MTSIHYIILLLISVFTGITGCEERADEVRDDFKKYYDEFNVDGCFILYDENLNKYILYNPEQTRQPYTPASTFKICNSLIGLETGVIRDENSLIPWDSVSRNRVWDKDHDLKSAFKNSVVWYYQEVARQIGDEKMKYWLDRVNYGNADTTGGIDMFWLEGGLRISPVQQIDFLVRFNNSELPFSQHALDITQKIMLDREAPDYTLRGKTGWGAQDGKDIGWFVGFVETDEGTYYFSNCIFTESETNNDVQNAINFNKSRKEIVYQILSDLGIIRQEEL